MTWYALCNGENLRECGACRRNADNHERVDEHQQFVSPQQRNGKCCDWMPMQRTPKRVEDKL